MRFAGEVLSPVYYLQLQLEAEVERQQGWRTVCAGSGGAPERLPRDGELVFGPAGAHLELDSCACRGGPSR